MYDYRKKITEHMVHCDHYTRTMAEAIHEEGMKHIEQQLMQLLRFASRYSSKRLEDACHRTLYYGYNSIKLVQYVLQHRLDRLPLSPQADIYGQMHFDL